MRHVSASAIILLLAIDSTSFAEKSAKDLLQSAGVTGGLVVHVGCGDGRLTATFGTCDRFLVHGLDADEDNVALARKRVNSMGIYGKVSIEVWPSKQLPYGDNLVNLLVVDEAVELSQDEIARVLCPGGVALMRKGNRWGEVRKTWPNDIDQWTHYLYDASNNAVAKDRRVGPPRHVQWTAGPKRLRDHDALSSFTTMTSSRGRVFYIVDEGPTSQIHRQPQWRLVARDAFNGVLLWKREIPTWLTHLYNFRVGPVQMTRRLVSVGDRVYVTLGYDAPITLLDAATGETLRTYDDSNNAEEILLHDGVLLSVLGDPKIFDKEAPTISGYWETRREGTPSVAKSIAAYQAETGKLLWKNTGANLARLVPLSLTSADGKVFYLDGENLHCAELQTGRPLWQTAYGSKGLFLRNYAPTVVWHKGVVVCLSIDKMAAFSATDGKSLWRKEQGYYGFGSSGDLFAIGDLVWTFPGTQGIKYADKRQILGKGGSEFWALDLMTGEVKQSIAKKDVWPGGHHHRCYRNKATEQFAVCGRRGVEFVDLTGGDENVINWWVRGICQYGVMPCNGMVYVPPDPCRCFSTIKLDGLLALAANNSLDDVTASESDRLHKGSAYERGPSLSPDASRPQPSSDWPTYRGNIARSGAAPTAISHQLAAKWRTHLGGELSSVTIGQQRLFVSAIDRHTVYCLDADTGEQSWSFTAGGPVDSPPTIYGDLAIFGSRDGRVYALSADEGRLVWSFRAGPIDRRIVSDGRLESVWPVCGSVLVLDDVAYFAAGRSSFVDGGILLYGLNVFSGEKLCQTSIDSAPVHNKNTGALPDVLVSDGTSIYMRQLAFDKQLSGAQGGKRRGFSAATGLLEDGWGHRLTWRLGGAVGNLLVFNDAHVYGARSRYTGWKKDRKNWPPTHTGHLHQKYSRYKPEWFPIGNQIFRQKKNAAKEARRQGTEANAKSQWAKNLPIQVRAMILAGDTLFAAGWPDAVTILGQAAPGSERRHQNPKLWSLAAADGQQIAEYELDGLPVFDGLATAHGRLYLTTQDGSVTCYTEK